MTSFVTLHRGENVREAKMVAITSEPRIVGLLASELLGDQFEFDDTGDPIIGALDGGRRAALRLIAGGAADAHA